MLMTAHMDSWKQLFSIVRNLHGHSDNFIIIPGLCVNSQPFKERGLYGCKDYDDNSYATNLLHYRETVHSRP